MSKYLLRSFFICCFLSVFLIPKSSAEHLIGGDMTYRIVRYDTLNNTFTAEFILTIYRDGFQGGRLPLTGFDMNAEIGFFQGREGRGWNLIEIQSPAGCSPVENIPVPQDPCIIPPDNLIADKLEYCFEETFDVVDDDYRMVYQRCCRNRTISNIVNPDDQGAVFGITIPASAQKPIKETDPNTGVTRVYGNSSPTFNIDQEILICVGYPRVFDLSATDVDGDSLVYKFCTPEVSGGKGGSPEAPNISATSCEGVTPSPRNCPPPYDEVIFRQGFSENNPLPGNPAFVLDPNTGQLAGTPNIAGQYVVGICVEEWRDGVQIGELKRDFQYNVTNCLTPEPDFGAGSPNGPPPESGTFDVESYKSEGCGFNVKITNYADSRVVQSFFFATVINGVEQIYTEQEPVIMYPSEGDYSIEFVINQGEICEARDTIFFTLLDALNADFVHDGQECQPVVQFMDVTVTQDNIDFWEWTFGSEGTSSVQNPSFRFSSAGTYDVSLRLTDQFDCTSNISKPVDYYPIPERIVIEPDKFLECAPGEILFDNLSEYLTEDYDILWNFGDGTSSTELSPTHVYNVPGKYNVSVSASNIYGCGVNANYSDFIEILTRPQAGFDHEPEEVKNLATPVVFTNMSTPTDISSQWYINNALESTNFNYTHFFQDTGLFNAMLVVTNELGCTDTSLVQIPVFPTINPIFPNAFRPRSTNAVNRVFKPNLAEGALPVSYDFRIFNKWGEQIFETEDPSVGWDGKGSIEGEEFAPQGTYVYKLRFINFERERKTLTGTFILLL